MRAPAVLLLVLALILSGCAAKGQPKSQPATSTDADVLPDGIQNRLEGTVQGTDLSPLVNATVEVQGTNETRRTDALGHFQFDNLEPRDYLVIASKEGYRAKTQRTVIADGAIFELDFILEEIPSRQPYHDTQEFTGFLSCQAAYQTAPDNTQYTDCGTADPNNRPTKDFGVQADAAQVQVEVAWTPTTSAATALTVTVESPGPDGVIFGQDHGESGIKIVVSESLTRKYFPQGGPLRVTLRAGPSVFGDESAVDAGLAFQQDFKVYVTVFYVESGPNGFSAIPK